MKFRSLSGFLVATVLSLLVGCAVNPVTGQQQLMLVSEQDELRMGIETDKSVIDQYGFYDDPGLQSYLQGIGLPMARSSHRPNLNWQFKVMDSPVINAFAAPGGFIYVTRGLLAAANNEAELAGVLGHEIGHVTARHSAQQYSKMMLANLGLNVGQTLLGDYNNVLGKAMETGAGLLFLKFSRDDEREADALSVEYATRSGYDAARIADFFTTLQRQGTGSGQKQARLPEFFSTHPSPVNREANVRSMAAARRAAAPGRVLRVDRGALLRRIDGLVYGEDPRKGYREGDWYYLPQYGVKLPIPNGWAFEREGNNLQMVHPEEKGVALLAIRPDSRVDQVAKGFLTSSGAELKKNTLSEKNGMQVRHTLSLIDAGSQRVVVASHFYQRGPDVFAFHGMTDLKTYQSMSNLVQAPALGFGRLTDQGKLNRQPRRIVIRSVKRSATMEQTLRAMKVDQGLWDKIAWLNGRRRGDLLSAGEQIKLIR